MSDVTPDYDDPDWQNVKHDTLTLDCMGGDHADCALPDHCRCDCHRPDAPYVISDGDVYRDRRYIGYVNPSPIAGKRIWRAYDRDGVRQPVGGNLAHPTREAAVRALVEAVDR